MLDNFTLASVVREHGRARRDNVAIVDGDRRLTYGGLADRAERLAQGLVERSIGPGGRVLWLGQNSGAVIELIVACARVGAIFCPVNWRQSAEELTWAVRDFDPGLVVTQQCEVSAQFALVRAALDDDFVGQWYDSDPESGLDPLFGSAETALPDPGILSGAFAIYTAAFDGKPQAAVLSNMAILFQNILLGRDQAVDETSVFLNSGPMFHMGTMMTTFAVLHHSGTNVIVRRADAERILDLIESEACTHAFLMPPTLAEMEEAQAARARTLTSLWPSGTIERPKGVLIMPPAAPMFGVGGLYGQSETCGIIMNAARGGGGAGKAALAEVRLVDADDREVADGEVGEIVVRTPLLMNGYWNRETENAYRGRGGWHHTRDLGRRRADGGIDFIGPNAVLIKSAAENIYPAEVETCLRQHPAVADVCVIGVPDAVWGQSVKAVVQLKEDCSAAEDDLVAHCRDRISSYKKPRFVTFVDALPRAPAGFVDRAAVDGAHGGGGYPSVN